MASYFPDGVFHDETNAYPRIPPTKVACLKASEKLEHPIISEPTNTTSFGRHKALDWWVALYILESNPRTWGEHNIITFLEIWGDLRISTFEFFLYQPKFQRLRTSLWTSPSPDRFSMMFSKNHATGKLLSKLDLLQRSNLGSWTNHRENGGKTPWDGTLNNQPHIHLI